MSIILDALKKAKKEAESEPVKKEKVDIENLNYEGGFFGGAKSEPIIESKPILENFRNILTKRNIVLLSVLVVLLLVVFVVKLVKKESKDLVVNNAVQQAKPQANNLQSGSQMQDAVKEQGQLNVDLAFKKAVLDAKQAFDSGDYDKSIELYRKAVELKPEDSAVRNSLGLVFLKKGFYSSANTEFMKALEINDKCAECYNNFGYLKSVLGETFEAKSYLEKAISLSVSYPEPYFNMAVLYEKEGDIGNAVKFYRQFLEYYPNKDNELAYKVNTKIRVLSGK